MYIAMMIGKSAAFQLVERQIASVASYDVPVLIEGETGTGKELIARSIHYRSARKDRPFIPINCGALPDGLVESQLFGHRRGAFSDARDHQQGLVSLAHLGTLFLDEVETLTVKGQVSLLRFVQDQRFRPLGDTSEQQADVRIITATNQPLEKLVEAGNFRLDLLYRLKLIHLRVPPLRERGNDIALLASHFVQTGAARFGCSARPLSWRTLDWLQRYAWPGNVRELEHVVYQALLLCESDEIDIPPPAELGASAREDNGLGSFRCAKARAVSTFEQAYLVDLLERTRGNISAAARVAGTERRHLGRLLRKHGIKSAARET